MHSPLPRCSTYRSVFHSLPPPRSLPRPVFLRSTLMHSRLSLVHSLRHSLQLFMSRLNRRRLLSIIGSFLLALPLHHSLISLPHFQCPAHSAAHSNRSSCPHHESFMDQYLFSVFDWQCSVQASDSLQGGSSNIRLQQRTGPAGQTSSHSYQITLIVSPAVF